MRRKENIPFFLFAEKKIKKRNILGRIGAVSGPYISGPYRGRIGMTLDTRPYWDHSLSKNEM